MINHFYGNHERTKQQKNILRTECIWSAYGKAANYQWLSLVDNVVTTQQAKDIGPINIRILELFQ